MLHIVMPGLQILLEDSLGERVWVDRPDCMMFIQNVQSAFNTKFRSPSSTDTKIDQSISAGKGLCKVK